METAWVVNAARFSFHPPSSILIDCIVDDSKLALTAATTFADQVPVADISFVAP